MAPLRSLKLNPAFNSGSLVESLASTSISNQPHAQHGEHGNANSSSPKPTSAENTSFAVDVYQKDAMQPSSVETTQVHTTVLQQSPSVLVNASISNGLQGPPPQVCDLTYTQHQSDSSRETHHRSSSQAMSRGILHVSSISPQIPEPPLVNYELSGFQPQSNLQSNPVIYELSADTVSSNPSVGTIPPVYNFTTSFPPPPSHLSPQSQEVLQVQSSPMTAIGSEPTSYFNVPVLPSPIPSDQAKPPIQRLPGPPPILPPRFQHSISFPPPPPPPPSRMPLQSSYSSGSLPYGKQDSSTKTLFAGNQAQIPPSFPPPPPSPYQIHQNSLLQFDPPPTQAQESSTKEESPQDLNPGVYDPNMLSFPPPPPSPNPESPLSELESSDPLNPSKKVSRRERLKEEMKRAKGDPKAYWKESTQLEDGSSKREKLKDEFKSAKEDPKTYWKEASTKKKVALVGGAVVVGVIGTQAVGAAGGVATIANGAGMVAASAGAYASGLASLATIAGYANQAAGNF